ncbi:hypothetical protein [Prevotella sp. HUN102]|uniref:hypothetical protein n=1 Tax=Prevotella sp. HUN102 TaxID=1392486 RepID=UPI000A61724A|nr:hypothetical protein [Prevotella sp. HUN102]
MGIIEKYINEALLKAEIAIDNAVIDGKPVEELVSIKSCLLEAKKSLYYANTKE